MEKSERVFAFVSDLHTGSRSAVWVKLYNELLASPGQLQLLESLKDFQDKCKSAGVEAVGLLGDLIEGNNRKEMSLGLVTADLNEQMDVAVDLLRPFYSQGEKCFGVCGTGYHRSLDTATEKYIIERLGGQYFGGIANREVTGTGKNFAMMHGEGGSLIYGATKLHRDQFERLQSVARGKMVKPDIILTGHLHNFIRVDSCETISVQLPCWKAFEDSKIFRRSPGKMQSDIGGVIVKFPKNGKIEVQEHLYPLPHIFDMVEGI